MIVKSNFYLRLLRVWASRNGFPGKSEAEPDFVNGQVVERDHSRRDGDHDCKWKSFSLRKKTLVSEWTRLPPMTSCMDRLRCNRTGSGV